ncbi:hypothetical protein SSE37_06184 [Sagittula stellata E-37]|uniref:Uncharacterized protein n=1 Tax=Sagittula stellata (strain ATCC 700073 / DSM 11524 / E-37) TaxID=388399 RepID=A3K652_SAGS3|nr:hypothetical protein SSE37_06184 [Sagittula stellata E-37]
MCDKLLQDSQIYKIYNNILCQGEADLLLLKMLQPIQFPEIENRCDRLIFKI